MKRLHCLAAVLFLLLASCGTPEPPLPSDPSPSDPNEPVLTKRNITLTVWESEAALPFIEAAADEFTKKYPNISVRAVAVEPEEAAAGFRDAESANLSSLSSASQPDLFAVPHTDIRRLAENLDILPARNQEKARSSSQLACVRGATVNGIIYGYPVAASTLALFYNREVVKEPPGTWSGLASFSASFEGTYGFILPVGSAYHVLPFTTLGNNLLFGPSGENAQNSFLQSPPAIAGMGTFASLRAALDVPAAELTTEKSVSAFASGQAAICVAGSWDVAAFTGIDYAVAPLPAFDDGGMGATAPADIRVMVVSAWSEQPDEASAFADFLLTEPMQRLRLSLTGEIPSVSFTAVSPPYAAGFIRQLENAFATPTIPGADRFWSGFGFVASRIWDGADPAEQLSAFNASIVTPPVADGGS